MDPTTDALVGAASRGDVGGVNNILTGLQVAGVDTAPYQQYVGFAQAYKDINDAKGGGAPRREYPKLADAGKVSKTPGAQIAPPGMNVPTGGACMTGGDFDPPPAQDTTLPYTGPGKAFDAFDRASNQLTGSNVSLGDRFEGLVGVIVTFVPAFLEEQVRGVANVPHETQAAVRSFSKGEIGAGVGHTLNAAGGLATAFGVAKGVGAGLANALDAAPAQLERPPPQVPVFEGGKRAKTYGVLRTPTGDTPLVSGYGWPSSEVKSIPGMNGNIKSHVEAHASALMRMEGLEEATLYINRVPCGGLRGCDRMLERMLPSGARLRVIGPDGFDHTYTGTPD